MTYQIICEDSLKWLTEQPDHSLGSFLTGLPDMNEVSMNLEDYILFFRKSASLIFNKMSKTSYAIFIQTDRKTDGNWIDKSYLLTDTAYHLNVKLLWHKIVLQREVNKIHLQRPTYSHVLCYSYMNKPSKCFPDVLPIGNKVYENSTPSTASEACSQFLSEIYNKKSTLNLGLGLDLNLDIKNTIIDPFVGRGTTILSLCSRGLSAIGIDIDKTQCIECRKYLKKELKTEESTLINNDNISDITTKKFNFIFKN